MNEKSFLEKYAEPPKGFGVKKDQSDKKQSEIQKNKKKHNYMTRVCY